MTQRALYPVGYLCHDAGKVERIDLGVTDGVPHVAPLGGGRSVPVHFLTRGGVTFQSTAYLIWEPLLERLDPALLVPCPECGGADWACEACHSVGVVLDARVAWAQLDPTLLRKVGVPR